LNVSEADWLRYQTEQILAVNNEEFEGATERKKEDTFF